MKFAKVIGRVTLNVMDPAFLGSRFLLALPCSPDVGHESAKPPFPKGNSIVVYDNLGATEGDLIAYTDGGEASAPFPQPTPCDAYNAAILDRVNYFPTS